MLFTNNALTGPYLQKKIYMCCIFIFKILKGFAKLDTTEETEIILISDGQNNVGTLGNVTKDFVDAGVVIHSVTVTERADQILVDLAKKTRGRSFENDAQDFHRLITVFSEIVSGGPVPNSNSPITVWLHFGFIHIVFSFLLSKTREYFS